MGNGIWHSEKRAVVRGASARQFDMADKNKYGMWDGKKFTEPLSHGREFTKDEIWANYTYFIKQVVPVAEEAGVRIGIHPDDPPVPVLAGVPRCIFGNFEGYKRAMEIAQQSQRGDLSVLRDVARGRQETHRKRPGGDDPLLRSE
jgi:mannonate dehydratase